MKGWQLGQIEAVEEDTLTIILPLIGHKLRKDRWSGSIAKADSQTRFDQAWRQKCLEDLNMIKVDCFDGDQWREATILQGTEVDSRHGFPVTRVKVGFRVYRAHG